jgi:hypothetical protein
MRAPSKPPAPRTREQIETEFRADIDTWLPKRRFRSGFEAEFVHWVWQYQEHRWTRETILAARDDPFLRECWYFDAAWVDMYFGRTRPRQPWLIVARLLAGLLNQALDRKAFGSADGPFMSFLHAQLVRLLGAAAVPLQETVWRELNRAAC